MVINGVLWRTRAGAPWRDLPVEYGSWKTVYNRHRRWSLDGTWSRVRDRLRVGADAVEGADWALWVDSTVARAHQHAAGARRAPAADDVAGQADPVRTDTTSDTTTDTTVVVAEVLTGG